VNQPFYALSRKSLTVQVGIRSLRFAIRNVSVRLELHLHDFPKGKNNMNAKGLIFTLGGVIADLDMGAAAGISSFSQKLVDDGAVSQSELDGTRNNLKALVATLKNTPEEKIEALVAQFDKDLSAYLDKFNALGSGALIEKFRIAQIMSGLAVSIMAKAGVKG
jgi:hypothetical protein